jgi:uncharacterized protein YndB with AHSA1/START domain
MVATYSLQIDRIIPGPIEEVFDAWLDPDSLRQWMTPGPGMVVPTATTDPRVGGRFLIVMKDPTGEIRHDGEYRVIDRPKQLVFTWNSEPAGRTLVTVDFEKVTTSSTKVTLTHEQLTSEGSRDAHRMGWGGILAALEQAQATKASVNARRA